MHDNDHNANKGVSQDKRNLCIPHTIPMLQRRRLRYPPVTLPPIRRRRLTHLRRISTLLPVRPSRRDTTRRRRRRRASSPAASLVRWGTASVRRRLRGILGLGPAAAVRAPAAAQDAQQQGAAEAGSQPDDEPKVVVDPGFDFRADVAVASALGESVWCCVREFGTYVCAVSAGADGAVEEVLLQPVAYAATEFGRPA